MPGRSRTHLKRPESLKRTLRNHQSKNHPKSPRSLDTLVIEGEFALISDEWDDDEIRERRFLLTDNGVDAPSRIIIFATDDALEQLSSYQEWYADGNFKLAPRLFCQLYVIRICVSGVMITAAYALLENKTREVYEEMFNTLKVEAEARNFVLSPRKIHVDFEKAVMTAVVNVFGHDVNIQGCFYHLCQSTYRHIQQLHLQGEYTRDESIVRSCAMIDALAFLPISDVEDGVRYLRDNIADSVQPHLDYFVKTYVSGTTAKPGKRGNTVRFRIKPPMFPPPTWNIHDAVLTGGDCTNNVVEGWNNRFNHIVGMHHPNIWVLIKKIKEETLVDESNVEQRNAGLVPSKRRKPDSEYRQQQLKAVTLKYSRGETDLPNFLKRIANIIRLRLID